MEGTIEGYQDRGVFAPEGVNAAQIMEGAWALERQFDVAPYISRLMAIAVLKAIAQLPERSANQEVRIVVAECVFV